MCPSKLTTIEVSDKNPAYTAIDNVLFTKDMRTLVYCVPSKEGIYSIPYGVTCIDDGAFSFSALSDIALPETVTSIGNYAFENCYKITNINIPSNVSNIGERVFSWCSKLASIAIPEGIAGIGYGAFYQCRGLISVTLPSTVTTVSDNAFAGCSGLTIVNYSGTQAQREAISIGRSNEPLTSAAWNYCYVPNTLNLPAQLTSIESHAFASVKAEQIVIPENVGKIESRAFANCSNLKYLRFLGNPYSIADDILSGCPNAITIRCKQGSSVAAWARACGYTVEFE